MTQVSTRVSWLRYKLRHVTYLSLTVDLPQYTSYEKLRTQLLLAINEGGEGFGFA